MTSPIGEGRRTHPSSAGPTDDVAERLVEAFDAFGPAYIRLLGRGGRSGISWSQVRILEALHCDGPLKLSELGGRLGVTRRNVTSLVDRLERDGLARRVAHPDDRRAILLESTKEGEAFGRRHYASQRAKAVDLFRGLPRAEQEQLLGIIDRLRSELEEHDRGTRPTEDIAARDAEARSGHDPDS